MDSVPALDLQLVADLAKASVAPQVVHVDTLAPGLPKTVPFLWDGARGVAVDLKPLMEKHRLKPVAKSGTAKALTLESFIALVNRHKVDGTSAVFAATDWRQPKFSAVIDYAPPGTDPDNQKHRIDYAFPLSEEWQAWVAVSKAGAIEQGALAEFIEDHIADLSSPTDLERVELEDKFSTTIATPAEIMKLSRGLQVHVEARVKNVVTLQSGAAQMAFEESHKDADGKPLFVPGLFMLQVAPFFGGERIRIPVRLRYRQAAGSVKWMLQLYRPDIHVTGRVRDDLAQVASQTGLPTYEGAPEVSAT